ncbi:uroporphyrinogen-III C-methyltransferase [Carboxylicivirga sp. M1479]|uniref:uroporphyrinogen-III C-methyltransferase n=1 Tax=Carboxylicivirga sp. M1479 TaxID=2594476 RepID=UPI001177AF6A|nr:uroporphyrinogen-III C-methyltransferase [Carboxylicivirga sp. M1479]TRX65970.1 uroporphyrinogen-III C-methyltransferase [Carboxylicivirga sp. M1479]
MNIHILSYAPLNTKLFNALTQAVPNHTHLNWSYNKQQQVLATSHLMEQLVQGVDIAIVPHDMLEYPLNERLNILAVFPNAEEVYRPYLVVALSNQLPVALKAISGDLQSQYGQVHIAGFGPGNPELLTIKTQRLIEAADVIYYDDLLDDKYLKAYNKELVYVGKRKGKHSAKQEDINKLLFEAALEGKNVLRLKGGDPLIFGRGAEEYHYLKQRMVQVQLVPGITSALAAASDFAVPLTSRGTSTSVAFTLGHDAIYNKLPQADTLVFYMGASQQKKWAQRLLDSGWAGNTPVACVRNASLDTKQAKRYTLIELLQTDEVLPAPALLIVGQTAHVSPNALNKKWLYTGIDLKYFKEEGQVVHNPLLELEALELNQEQKDLLKNIKAFSHIVFATPFAVHQFFNALFNCQLDVRALADIELSSIGVSTSKALRQYGLSILPESTDNSALGLKRSLENKGVRQSTILIPCAKDGLSYLPKALGELGNHVHELKLYRTSLPANAVQHNLKDFYGVVFTSPKAVHHFFKHYVSLPHHLHIKVRGGLTREVLNKYIEQFQMKNIVSDLCGTAEVID